MATPAGTVSAAAKSGEGADAAHAWEDTGGRQTWEHVQEDADGNIVVAASDSLSEAIRKRRKNLERQDYAQRHRRVVRDMIRYVYIVIDASRWTRPVKDPVFPGGATRVQVMTRLLTEFVQEYYDQNPVSHLGLVLVQQGEAEILTTLSGSKGTHKRALASLAENCAAHPQQGGEFSLQNGLEVAGRSLGHQPKHGSREIVVVTAALSTCDPGYILTETLPKLQQSQIRVSCIALSAELYICRKLSEETGGTMAVCLDQQFFRDWLLAQCTPPPSAIQPNHDDGTATVKGCEMIEMGFPSRTSQEIAELVHAGRQKTLLARTAFTCPQCQGKNSELPTDCAVCGLKLVLAPHLARTFHHLFPIPPFEERPMMDRQQQQQNIEPSSSLSSALLVRSHLDDGLLVTSSTSSKKDQEQDDDGCCDMACYACLRPLVISDNEVLRLQCPDCKNLFCVDCDAFLHNSLHNCPGCLCK